MRHLLYSIFTPRRKEAESRTFWDTDRVVRKALDIDFGRMLKEDRILKLIAKSDNAVVNGEKTVAESLEEVRERDQRNVCILTPRFAHLLACVRGATLAVLRRGRGLSPVPDVPENVEFATHLLVILPRIFCARIF